MLAMVRARWRADVIRRCVTAMGRHAHGPPCIPVKAVMYGSLPVMTNSCIPRIPRICKIKYKFRIRDVIKYP